MNQTIVNHMEQTVRQLLNREQPELFNFKFTVRRNDFKSEITVKAETMKEAEKTVTYYYSSNVEFLGCKQTKIEVK